MPRCTSNERAGSSSSWPRRRSASPGREGCPGSRECRGCRGWPGARPCRTSWRPPRPPLPPWRARTWGGWSSPAAACCSRRPRRPWRTRRARRAGPGVDWGGRGGEGASATPGTPGAPETAEIQEAPAAGARLRAFLAGESAAPPSELLPGARYLLGVPIDIDGSPRGLLAVGDKESRRGVGPFPPSDRRTLGLFANQAAIALENARLHLQALEKERLEREMQLAADIQRRILPRGAPEVPGYELLGWNRPARQIGGDYYDLFQRQDGRVGLVVGDVSGKGMPAALMVSTLHSALHLLLDQVGVGPALLEMLNRHVFESSAANKFITLLLAELEPPSRPPT